MSGVIWVPAALPQQVYAFPKVESVMEVPVVLVVVLPTVIAMPLPSGPGVCLTAIRARNRSGKW